MSLPAVAEDPFEYYEQVGAEAVVGKRLLVGLTYFAQGDETERLTEFHGEIVAADQAEIALRRADTGEDFTLPPGLLPASPGEYRLRSSGEVVVDPDYLASWTIAPPGTDE